MLCLNYMQYFYRYCVNLCMCACVFFYNRTDNSESKTVHHKKDMLEYADFRRTAQNIKNVKVAPNVQRIIQILMEQLER